MAEAGTLNVGRKKIDSEDKFLVVKIDRAIGMKARVLAADCEKSMADYLSGLLRGPVDKEWAKMVRKTGGAGE